MSFSLIFIGCTDETLPETEKEFDVNPTVKQGVCYFSNNHCQLSVAGLDLSATLSRQPRSEEPIDVTIFYPIGEQIESVWLNGVNMYMGKIPVIIDTTQVEKSQLAASGWFMFGACNQPNMEWELVVSLKGRQEPARMRFTVAE